MTKIQQIVNETSRLLQFKKQNLCFKMIYLLIVGFTFSIPTHAQTNNTVNLGKLTDYLFVFTDGSKDAKWQTSKIGYIGNVAVNGLKAKENASVREKIPFAGIVYSSDVTLNGWQALITYNPTQASSSLNQTARLLGLSTDLQNAFTQINGLTATPGYTNRSAISLNGLNTKNNISETFVINVTSGFKIRTRIYITGDAGDIYILRWDEDAKSVNGYQGNVQFHKGSGIIPMGDLKPTNFIHVAGDISASGGGTTPPLPYPQGPRSNFGRGTLIANGKDFNGGGFFTGYWLTTGNPRNKETGSLKEATFVGGWYTSSTKFELTRNCGGVYLGGQCATLSTITGDASVMVGTSIILNNQSSGGTWSSSNNAIATVNPTTGAVQGIAPGNAIITYSTANACIPATKNIAVLNNRVMKLGNLVWNDQNRNGRQDVNELGVASVKATLYLDNNADNIPDGVGISTIYTNASGNYQFNNLLPGNYIVGVTMPTGYTSSIITPTSGTPNNDNTGDNNGVILYANELRSKSISLILANEPTNDGNDSYGNMTLDFGLMGTGSIGDFIWSDINGNGVQDGDIEADEIGLVNVTVTLVYPNGATESTVTNASGGYSFTNLAPGNYTVRFTQPYGYNASPSTQGANTIKDSDPINGAANVTLSAGENKNSIDAGFQSSCLTLRATASSSVAPNGVFTVVIAATGGLAPYSGTGSFNVAAGDYWYIVTDAFGCSNTVFIHVQTPSSMRTNEDNGDQQIASSEIDRVGNYSGANLGENGGSSISTLSAKVFPNPCTSYANIEFNNSKEDAHAVVEIYSMTGQKVAKIFDENIKKNETYNARIETSELSAGTYIYRVICGSEMQQGRVMLK